MKKLIAVVVSFVALDAAAASIVPAEPRPFEVVNLRMTVDSCIYNPEATSVSSMHQNHIVVTSPQRNCLVPGTPEVVDIRLGAFPPGDYTVAVHADPRNFAPPYVEARFTVVPLAEIAVFPPPPKPLTDYSGVWWNPQESGWGVSIHQGPGNVVFAMLFVYGANNQPEWYSLQMGRWTSSTTWTGTMFRTTGPSFSAPVFDPAQVSYAGLGPVTLDFKQLPGQEGTARITYLVGGDAVVTKTIRRMPL